MKNKYLVFFALILLSCYYNFTLAWGKRGHRLINSKAIELLPDEMQAMKTWKDYIAEHASDPDERRHSDSTEAVKHFIDLDYYHDFIQGKMIQDKEQLIAKYGNDTVTKIGLLPWATIETYDNLVKAFREKNRDKVLIFTTDLGHYIADGHQPFHVILNYDGQLTNQKGIHGRYESEMVNRYIDQIENIVIEKKVSYVSNQISFIFDYLTISNLYSSVIFDADKIAYDQANSHGSDDYFRILWFRTKHLTIELISNATAVLASFIYSAWVDGGKPNLAELN